MLNLPPSVQIYLAAVPVDMRKGHHGLLAIIREEWKKDPHGGHLFVFIGKRRDRAKIVFWDHGGFVLYYKCLDRGRFQMPQVNKNTKTVMLESAQLTMLLSGIDLNVERLRRWRPPQEAIDN